MTGSMSINPLEQILISKQIRIFMELNVVVVILGRKFT